MKLSYLYLNQPPIEITSITLDSRKVVPGSLFFCVDGYEDDGHLYADSAAAKGAAVIVHTKGLIKRPGVIYIRVKDINQELNRVADIFYGQPSRKMTMFGATGTNGKSTVTSIIRDIYNHYTPCGYMGTIAVRYGDYSRIPNLTTPDQIETNANLREMLDHGMKACAMEVSSQGLDRHRTDAVDFDCALFTNLTHDHLDYHKTLENYFEAKKRLFSQLKPNAVAVLNADDEVSYNGLKEACCCRTVSYGTDRGEGQVDAEGNPIEGSVSVIGSEATIDYFAKDIDLTGTGASFTLCHNGKEYPVRTNLVALYNVYNLVGAMAAMNECGMRIEDQLAYTEHIGLVDGRAETIEKGQDFTVIVDYAHTPDGYAKIFGYAREICPEGGRILAVFGCPGKRDHIKRPIMGRIAAEYADHIYLTSQDPRNEEPSVIIKDIIAGIKEALPLPTVSGTPKTPCTYEFIGDREEAIQHAVNDASAGDVILMLGKGNESYMYYEEGRRPYKTDKTAAEEALLTRLEK